MSELVISGIEEPLTSSLWSSVTATGATRVTNIKHSGDASLKILPISNAASSVRRDVSNYTVGAVYTRTYIYVHTFGTAIDPSIYEHQSSAVVQELMVRALRTGKLRLENILTAHTVDTSTTLSVDTWYRMEIDHLLSDTVGTMTLRLYLGNATTPLETIQTNGGTGEDTLATNLGLIYLGQRTNASSTCELYYDDFRVNYVAAADGLPAEPTGPGKTFMAVGNNDDNVVWTHNAGATQWEAVDDALTSIDDATTYARTSTNSQEDFLGITCHAEVPSTAVFHTASVWGRQASDGGTGVLLYRFWDHNSNPFSGGNITVSSTTFGSHNTSQHATASLAGFSRQNVNDSNIGYRSVSSTGTVERRVTAVWANISWLESPGQTLAVDSGSYSSSGQIALLRLASPLYLRHRK